MAVRNFQRFSDCNFVSAFELIFILKLKNVTSKTQKDHHSNKYFITICSTASICIIEASE